MRLDLKVVMSQVLSKVLLQVLVHVLVCSQTLAQAAPQDSIVGLWVTHDDDTQEPRAHIKIRLDNGVLSGRIVKILDPNASPDERCTQCAGDRKNQTLPRSGDHLGGPVKKMTKNRFGRRAGSWTPKKERSIDLKSG